MPEGRDTYNAEALRAMDKETRDKIISTYLEEIFRYPYGFLNVNSDLIDLENIREDSSGGLMLPWSKDARLPTPRNHLNNSLKL